MWIIAKQVFAPTFVNAYLNAARLMIVIKLVSLNLYNCLWFIISLISLWCWQTNFRGKLKCFFTNLAARTAAGYAGYAGYLFCSSLPGGNNTFTLSPRHAQANWSKGLENLCRSPAKFHCHTWAYSTRSTQHSFLGLPSVVKGHECISGRQMICWSCQYWVWHNIINNVPWHKSCIKSITTKWPVYDE